MGGTSFDVSLIVDGEPGVSAEAHLEGLPMLMSVVNIHTVGAGGGSVAWVEAGGLRGRQPAWGLFGGEDATGPEVVINPGRPDGRTRPDPTHGHITLFGSPSNSVMCP